MFNLNGLKTWFLSEQRDLPWRRDRSPYAVWVSEMMLQQTQVSVVIPYFERWMQRFPSIIHLADASLDEVIKVWEGLGYYSRARYLHEGAKYIAKHHLGVFPNSPEDLAKIKGLGPYTIGAVRSFAFRHRVPAVDGNVIRVLTRLFAIKEDISKPATLKKIRELAEGILPDDEHWIVNEALIELGATICSKKPKCSLCPLKRQCQSYAQGIADQLPFKSSKTQSEALYRAVAVIEWQGHYLIRRGQKGEIMSDLHEFPFLDTVQAGISVKTLKTKMEKWLKCTLEGGDPMPEVAHSFTRFRVRLRPVKFVCTGNSLPKHDNGYMWVRFSGLGGLAFSSGHRRILAHMIKETG